MRIWNRCPSGSESHHLRNPLLFQIIIYKAWLKTCPFKEVPIYLPVSIAASLVIGLAMISHIRGGIAFWREVVCIWLDCLMIGVRIGESMRSNRMVLEFWLGFLRIKCRLKRAIWLKSVFIFCLIVISIKSNYNTFREMKKFS